jgi:NADH:ubiquinone oxidoreductase subunit F (NADH-binding)
VSAQDAWDLPLTNAALKTAGATLGTGVLYAFPADTCGLVAAARIADYLAGETAGQCGPCVYGLRAVSDAMTSIAAGDQVAAMVVRMRQVFDQVRGRGACHYPDGVIRFVETALTVFDDEVRRHDTHGACHQAEPPRLPTRSDGTWR